MKTSNITLTVEKMCDYANKGQLRFDNPVQRPFVWDIDRQSYLLDSVMRGFPMGVIHVDKVSGETKKDWFYDVMDGQQRCTTLYKFLNNEFELQGLEPFMFDDKEYDVNGYYFEDLPEELQKEIRSYAMNIVYCEDATQDEKAELFRKLNNGKALSAAQGILGSIKNFESVNKLGLHPAFEMLLTPAGKKSKKHFMYIAKIHTMLKAGEELGDVTFETKDFYEKMSHTVMTDNDLSEVSKILDYMVQVLEVAKEEIEKAEKKMPRKKVFSALKKEVHVASLVPFIKQAMDKGIRAKQFYDFCAEFLILNPDKKYVDAAKNDTSKTRRICDRNDAIEDAWNVYFDKHGIEPKVKVTVVEEPAKDTEPEVKAEEVA